MSDDPPPDYPTIEEIEAELAELGEDYSDTNLTNFERLWRQQIGEPGLEQRYSMQIGDPIRGGAQLIFSHQWGAPYVDVYTQVYDDNNTPWVVGTEIDMVDMIHLCERFLETIPGRYQGRITS